MVQRLSGQSFGFGRRGRGSKTVSDFQSTIKQRILPKFVVNGFVFGLGSSKDKKPILFGRQGKGGALARPIEIDSATGQTRQLDRQADGGVDRIIGNRERPTPLDRQPTQQAPPSSGAQKSTVNKQRRAQKRGKRVLRFDVGGLGNSSGINIPGV